MTRRAVGERVGVANIPIEGAAQVLTFERVEEVYRGTDVRGAFVRLKFGGDVNQAEVEAARTHLAAGGAAVVKVIRDAPAEVAAVEAEVDAEVGTIREEVMATLDAAKNIADREATLAIIEECLAEVGV